MSIKAIGNVDGIIEQVDLEENYSTPIIQGEDDYISNGKSRTEHFEGSYSALSGKMYGLKGSKNVRYECSLTRCHDGKHGKLQITTNYYIKKSDVEDDESGGGGENGTPGESTSEPSYSVTTSNVMEPILTHPKFAESIKGNINAPWVIGVNMMMNGASMADKLPSAINGIRYTVQQAIEDGGSTAAEIAGLIEQGITSYYSPHTVLTARYKVKGWSASGTASPGTITDSVPGGYKQKSGNWLCLGNGIEKSGSEYWMSETFELSPNGWNEEIYSHS